MLRRAPIAIAGLVIGCGLGCGSTTGPSNTSGTGGGGGSSSGGRAVNFDAGGPLGSGGVVTGAGGGGAGGLGGTGNTAGATPTGSLVFLGTRAELLSRGPCTSEKGATGDRWCAFTSGTNLFVVNVTQAAAGVSTSCGMTDPNCLMLTTTFFQEVAPTPVLHPALFGGDTLVYFDATGTPFAWRPGMPAGRALATADAATRDVVLCFPDIKGTAVTCLRDLPPAMQTDPQVFLSDLLAGRVDAAATPPLVKVETVIAESSADVNVFRFQVGFPIAGGDLLAWSARGMKGGPEILKTQTLGNDASRVTVASNVHAWSASPDGARWYWLSAVVENTRAGVLQTAPFPGGASPTMVATTTLGYDFPTPTSLISVNTGRQLLGYVDPAGAPATSQVMDTGVIGLVNLGAQGHVAYAKAVVASGTAQFIDLYLKKPDGTGACTISATTDAYLPNVFFNPSGSGLTWILRASGNVQARFTRLSDCMSMAVSTGAVWTEPAGDRGIFYIDSVTAAGLGSLRLLAVDQGPVVSAGPATLVSSQVGGFIVVSSASQDAVIYTVNAGGSEDGVYVKSVGN